MSGYVIETRRVETRKFPYTFRFAANNGVPYTSARSVKLCLSKNCFFHRENSFTKYSCPEIPRYQTNRSVFQNPIFHGTTRIAQYLRTRNSTVVDESVCVLEPGFPIRMAGYSRTRNFTVLEEQIRILDFDIPRYEKFHSAFLIHTTYYQVFLEKATNSPNNSAPSYQCIFLRTFTLKQ